MDLGRRMVGAPVVLMQPVLLLCRKRAVNGFELRVRSCQFDLQTRFEQGRS